jgi:hypothetical protein
MMMENEEASLGNEEPESGEESSIFDSEDSEVHNEEYGESNRCDGQSGEVFCEQLEDVMMGLETKNESVNANPDIEESKGVARNNTRKV